MIYFDNAATTFPKPGCVVQAVQQAMLYYGANPGRGGHDLSMQTGRMVHRCRERAAALFGCQPEQVVFTKTAPNRSISSSRDWRSRGTISSSPTWNTTRSTG